MLINHKAIALLARLFVSIGSIVCACSAGAQVAVPRPLFEIPGPHFNIVQLPLAVTETASVLGLRQVLAKLGENDAGLIQKLGFSSLNDVALATIGKPLPVYLVRLDNLKALAISQSGFLALLRSQGNLIGPLPLWGISREIPVRMLYPITVAGNTVTCIQVVFSSHKGMWRINSIGMSNLCKVVSALKENDDNFIMRIPSLNLYYLGLFNSPGSNEAMEFKALFNDRLIQGLGVGDKVSGSLLFSALKNEANTVNPQLAR